MNDIYGVLNGWDTDVESIRHDLENNYTKKKQTMNLESKVAENAVTLGYSGKNLFKITASSGTSKINSGISWTVNSDGSVTLNGNGTTTTTQEKIILGELDTSKIKPGEKYFLSGCPAGGNYSSSYALFIYNQNTSNTFISNTDINSVEFNMPENTVAIFAIILRANTIINTLTFYPMIRDASITDPTYEPYKPSVDERLAKTLSPVILDTGYKGEIQTETIENLSPGTYIIISYGSISPLPEGRYNPVAYLMNIQVNNQDSNKPVTLNYVPMTVNSDNNSTLSMSITGTEYQNTLTIQFDKKVWHGVFYIKIK